jgi:hypothetical protein
MHARRDRKQGGFFFRSISRITLGRDGLAPYIIPIRAKIIGPVVLSRLSTQCAAA